ncbi:Xaa-Pro aminopeptidase [Colwellia sp. MEBiC06753]
MLKNTLIPLSEFQQRRQALIDAMPENSVVVIKSAEEITRSNDTEFPFCQNKNFYYLTGFHEPDALLVLVKKQQQDYQSVFFCRDKDPLMEVWHGRRVGYEAAKTDFGFDVSFSNDEISEQLVGYLTNASAVLYCFDDIDVMTMISEANAQIASQFRIGHKPPATMLDCAPIIHELRLHKSANEIAVMRRANEISGNAHHRAMTSAAAGKFEYQIEAEMLHEFAVNGARHPAYGSIVAGGDNANILHYTDNDDVLNNGELLLIDAGGELAGYAADITRTFPVSGKFTEPQKIIYQLVLDSQIAVIDAIKPGNTFANLNDIACEVLTKGLYELGILQGDLPTLIAEKACKQYFIHGLGHWLGLDVHDVGDYQTTEQREQLRKFVPGMVMTIEPGLYIPKGCDADEKWHGIGVRIEDNILVTENGYENLSKDVVKTIADIESLMAQA